MIGWLEGKIIAKTAPVLLLNVNGLGYEIWLPVSHFNGLPKEGSIFSLFIYHHVREDIETLFGFISQAEKQLFKTLIKVNGLGPKLALTILSGLTPTELLNAVKENNVTPLLALPGVGKKTASRMILELQDKFKDAIFTELVGNSTDALEISLPSLAQDALMALVSLGYKQQDAKKMITPHLSKADNTESLIKLALQG